MPHRPRIDSSSPLSVPCSLSPTPTSSIDTSSVSSPDETITFPTLVSSTFTSPLPSRLTTLMIFSQQTGLTLTYYIFVSSNLSTCLGVPQDYCIFGLLLLQLPLSCIESIARLSQTNMVANALILYGVSSVLLYACAFNPSYAAADVPKYEEKWYLFIGTSVLLFEGLITLVVPLRAATPPSLGGGFFFRTLCGVVLGLACFYVAFSYACVRSFGPDVAIVLTSSLPPSDWTRSIQVTYSLAVALTFPLQNFPALEIVKSGRGLSRASRSLRGCVCVAAGSLASVLIKDDLDHLVSLTGALFGIPLSFVMPALMMNRRGEEGWRRTVNWAVVGVGGLLCAGATGSTVVSWNSKRER